MGETARSAELLWPDRVSTGARRMGLPVGSGNRAMVGEASGGPPGPRGWAWAPQPPTRCSLIDSPTATHREAEVQLTPVSA